MYNVLNNTVILVILVFINNNIMLHEYLLFFDFLLYAFVCSFVRLTNERNEKTKRTKRFTVDYIQTQHLPPYARQQLQTMIKRL